MLSTIFVLVALVATFAQAAPTAPLSVSPPTVGIEARISLPEESLTTPDLIRYHGYPAETHEVTTADGYKLQLHRIPHGRSSSTPSNVTRPVILLWHGLLESSASWVFNLPHQSAGFLHADAGYDVWLGNSRGNSYARGHVWLNPRHRDFWKFSIDEMATYDLQAAFDEIERVTGQRKIFYCGHSQGTTQMFAKLASEPEFADRVRRFYALAPVARVEYMKGGMRFLADVVIKKFKMLIDILGHGEFMPSSGIIRMMSKLVCDDERGEELCDNVIFLLAGASADSPMINKTRTGVYTGHSPAGTSLQNIVHWTQLIHSGRMQKFDHGSAILNHLHYAQSTPPLYDLSAIRVKMHLYTSQIDALATPQDIEEYLLPSLNPDYVEKRVHLDLYSHLDFLWSKSGADDIYSSILSNMQQLDAQS